MVVMRRYSLGSIDGRKQYGGSKKDLHHDNSLADTSIGPSWMQEHSQELDSAGPSLEFPSAGPSFMTDCLDTFDPQRSCDDLCASCSVDRLGGIDKGPPAQVKERTGIVTILEVPKVSVDGDLLPFIQKRILQVAAVPLHNCMVFDPLENERERGRQAEHVTKLLHPKTRMLFAELSEAGGFKRKSPKRASIHRPVSLPPRSYGSVSPSVTGSHSAREKRAFDVDRSSSISSRSPDGRVLTQMQGLPAAAKAPGSLWLRTMIRDVDDPSDPLRLDAGSRMKSFFPASAHT